MSTFMWIIIGALVGWVCFNHLHLNLAFGLLISVLFGVVMAVFGGNFLGPWIAVTIHPGEFNPVALLMAVAVPAASLIAAHIIFDYLDRE